MAKFYRNIDDTPLNVFIAVVTSGDISKLIYEPGDVNNEELSQAWEQIFEAYVDATMSEQDRTLFSMITSASILEFKISKAQAAQLYLSYLYDEEIVRILKQMGATSEGYPKEGSINARKVWNKRLTANIKRWMFTLSQIEAEIKKLSPEATPEEINAAHFDDILVRLSKYYGYHINESQVFVGRFLAMLRDYKHHLSLTNKQAKP